MVGSQSLPNEHRRRKSAAARPLVAVAAAICAAGLVFWITRSPGPGLNPDAASYMGAAESFAAGQGLRVPFADWKAVKPTDRLAHFPPGFPLAIATTVSAGLQAPQGARLIEAASAAATVGMLAYVVAVDVGLVAATALFAAIVFSRPLELVHLFVLSEPLFLFFVALTFVGMLRRWPALTLGCIAAAGTLVRFAGLALGVAAAFWQFLRPGSIRERLQRAVLAGAPTLIAYVAWAAHTRGGKHTTGIRKFGVYPGIGHTMVDGWRTIAQWLVPTSSVAPPPGWALFVALLIVLVFGALVWLAMRSFAISRLTDPRRSLAAVGVLTAAYLTVLVASRLLADPGIPFDYRILSPLVLLWATAAVIAVGSGFRQLPLPARGVIVVAFLAWCWTSSQVENDDIAWATSNGSDFAGEQWRTSSLLAWAKSDGRRTPLFTNWPAAVYFHLHRDAWLLPNTTRPDTLAIFVDTLRARNGVILEFDVASPDAIQPADLAKVPGLHVVAKGSDGTVYGALPP